MIDIFPSVNCGIKPFNLNYPDPHVLQLVALQEAQEGLFELDTLPSLL